MCTAPRIDEASTPEICVRLPIARDATSQLLVLWKAKQRSACNSRSDFGVLLFTVQKVGR